MELRLCPDGENPTVECFNNHVAEFVKDPKFGAPKDPNYSHYGHYADRTHYDYEMTFKLPDDVVGQKVLMQWKYITANSCLPAGYVDYNWPDPSWWSPNLELCKSLPWPEDGTRPGAVPEQFWNCAEITILPSTPTQSPKPTNHVVTKVPSKSPTKSPTPPVGNPTKAPSVSIDKCCSWDFKTCGHSPECDTSESQCRSVCDGLSYISKQDQCTGLGLYEDCTMNTNGCCSPLECVGSIWYKRCMVNPNPAPTSNPDSSSPTKSPAKPSNLPIATTTRYWDCSGGACGCAYLPFGPNDADNRPAMCHGNAMFAAPANNIYGAKYYGTAAISQALGGGDWLSEGCGKCWKVTGSSNISPFYQGVETTLVLKGVNYCPPGNSLCSNGNAHFDIGAPGFDVLQYSLSNTCADREADEIAGFESCKGWMIDSQNPDENCDCSLFKDPVLRAGCENFLSLKWDNSPVTYEEVDCPSELSRMNCWEENGNDYPDDIPQFCANNLVDEPPVSFPPTAPTPHSPTASPVKQSEYCCTWDYKTCADGWCSESKENCGNCGGGFWWDRQSLSCLWHWEDCTNNIDGCCDGFTCTGNENYRQCL
jgi:hypothetical protein